VTTPGTQRLNRASIVAGLLLAVLFGWAYLEALGWPERTGLYPRVVCLAGVVMSLGLVVRSVVGTLGRRRGSAARAEENGEKDDDKDDEDLEYVFQTAGARRWLAALGWVAVFVGCLVVLGLYGATLVFTLLYLRASARASWLVTIVYAVLATTILLLGTSVLLHVSVPEGLLPLNP
jgi:tripartite tricarboxylate transporter TctB family protein